MHMHVLKAAWQRTERDPELKFHELFWKRQLERETSSGNIKSNNTASHNDDKHTTEEGTAEEIPKQSHSKDRCVARALAAGCIRDTRHKNGETTPYVIPTSIPTGTTCKLPDHVNKEVKRRAASRKQSRKRNKDKVDTYPIDQVRNGVKGNLEDFSSLTLEDPSDDGHPNPSKERQLQWILIDQVGGSLDAVQSVRQLAQVFIDANEGMSCVSIKSP
jgi:hypothetical protein